MLSSVERVWLNLDPKYSLLQKIHTDLDIIARDGTLSCHSFMICAASPLLETCILKANIQTCECQRFCIILPDFSVSEVQTLARIIYGIDHEIAIELYELLGVLDILKKCNSGSGIEKTEYPEIGNVVSNTNLDTSIEIKTEDDSIQTFDCDAVHLNVPDFVNEESEESHFSEYDINSDSSGTEIDNRPSIQDLGKAINKRESTYTKRVQFDSSGIIARLGKNRPSCKKNLSQICDSQNSFTCFMGNCSYSGSNLHDLGYHITTTHSNNFVCFDCWAILKRYNLRHHVKYCPQVKCLECGEKFKHLRMATLHAKEKHSNLTMKHCKTCTFKLGTEHSLSEHEKICMPFPKGILGKQHRS